MSKKEKELEIVKLRKLLEQNKIEHIYNGSLKNDGDYMFGLGERQQIELYDGKNRILSVIFGRGTYGYESGLLEIMGLLTPEEEDNDSVLGYLTADNVYYRIMKYYATKKN